MDNLKIIFSGHAIRRIFERGLTKSEISLVIVSGIHIEEYPDDTPYPSYLILGFINEKPVHVVVAENIEKHECIVITTYIPDPEKWSDNFRQRRKK
jgi:uncharacterized protein DUF4258